MKQATARAEATGNSNDKIRGSFASLQDDDVKTGTSNGNGNSNGNGRSNRQRQKQQATAKENTGILRFAPG